MYMVRQLPVHGPVRQCTLYTGVFTARVHSRVRTVNMAVFRACLHGRVRCTLSCLRKVYTAVQGRVPRDGVVVRVLDYLVGGMLYLAPLILMEAVNFQIHQ